MRWRSIKSIIRMQVSAFCVAFLVLYTQVHAFDMKGLPIGQITFSDVATGTSSSCCGWGFNAISGSVGAELKSSLLWYSEQKSIKLPESIFSLIPADGLEIPITEAGLINPLIPTKFEASSKNIEFVGIKTTEKYVNNNACDDLWFARNSVMNDVGYCFGSMLGKRIFDNADCHTKRPKLSKIQKGQISQIIHFEKLLSCNVDTRKIDLELKFFELRKQLGTQPLNDGAESACIDAKIEKPIAVYADTNLESKILGYIQSGDGIGYDHIPFDNTPKNWGYISSVQRGDEELELLGWVMEGFTCGAYAG